MFEHLGLKNLPAYFAAAPPPRARGLFLNHGITSREGSWRRTLSTDFINRYVFPDGELDSVSNIQRVMERCEIEVLGMEALRPHYAMTLRHWVRRLEAHREAAVREVGESTYPGLAALHGRLRDAIRARRDGRLPDPAREKRRGVARLPRAYFFFEVDFC